jgi:hypothetical protein
MKAKAHKKLLYIVSHVSIRSRKTKRKQEVSLAGVVDLQTQHLVHVFVNSNLILSYFSYYINRPCSPKSC